MFTRHSRKVEARVLEPPSTEAAHGDQELIGQVIAGIIKSEAGNPEHCANADTCNNNNIFYGRGYGPNDEP